MFFFFRKPSVTLECYTFREPVLNNSPIISASKAVPEWFKNMKGEFMENGFVPRATIKKCPSIVSNITTGIIMPLWSDIALKNDTASGQLDWEVADGSDIKNHPSYQWGAFKNPSEYIHLKIVSPWRFKTKESLQFLWQNPYYHRTNPYLEVAQGIDNYQKTHATTINCFLDISKDYKSILSMNMPLVQLIPMTDKKVKIKNILISEKEWFKYGMPTPKFQSNHKLVNKCPFHKK